MLKIRILFEQLASHILFKNHKLSFGKAAELAGVSRDEFLLELDKNGIDFISYDPEELESEMTRF